MDEHVHEQRLPHVTLVLPLSSTEDDAKEAAHDLILNGLDLENFEILHVELMEEGEIRTKKGLIEGKRYLVAFRQVHGEVVYTHPDLDAIMRRGR